MLGLLGSMDFTTLVPGMYQASASLVLQTAALVGVIFVVVKIISYVRYRIRMEKIFGNLPGPVERHWLYGSFIAMRTLSSQERMMKLLEWGNMYAKKKGYVRIWGAFGFPAILACHPFSMGKILKTAEPKPLTRASGYRTLKNWLGDGLLISGGAKWARNRRLLTPAFHFDILKPYVDVYNDSVNVLIEKLAKFADEKQKIEVFQQICPLTLDIILRCAFSYEIDVQRSGETHPYVQAVTDLAITLAERSRNPLLNSDLLFNLTKRGRKFNRDCDYVHSVAEEIINKRRLVLEKADEVNKSKYLDFLDILLTAKDDTGVGLSNIDIRDEVDTFLFEGHDTTASAISWILYSIAQHPEYQQKCQEEIDGLLDGRQSDDILWSDLPHLEYLSMCIKEGMRLHCPVAIVARLTTKPLELGDFVCPPGISVVINILMLHHNEEVWGPDHMEFIPERFTRENVAKMDPYQFVPFSGGPRNCIGQNFAMNEEKVILAKLLHNFKFSLVPGHEAKWRLAAVMRAEDGIFMNVERRQH